MTDHFIYLFKILLVFTIKNVITTQMIQNFFFFLKEQRNVKVKFAFDPDSSHQLT